MLQQGVMEVEGAAAALELLSVVTVG